MIVMMPRGIAASSLSAFSASVASTLTSARTGAIPGLLPTRDRRSPGKTAAPFQLSLGSPSLTRPMPRGSFISLQA